MVPAVILKYVAIWSFADGRIVRNAGGAGGRCGCDGCVGSGIVARVGREGTLGVGLGGTDSFNHLVSFHFDFSVSKLAHQAQELAVAEFICLVVFDFLE